MEKTFEAIMQAVKHGNEVRFKSGLNNSLLVHVINPESTRSFKFELNKSTVNNMRLDTLDVIIGDKVKEMNSRAG